MFLVNFSDSEFNAIDFYMKTLGKDSCIPMTRIQSNESLSNKRIELYLKGGVFSISYKCLVLDLLTKRLSPSIIAGFIINSV